MRQKTTGGPEPLSARQTQAVELLMQGETVTGAAEALGVSRRTVQRWLTERNFAEALEHAQENAVNVAARRLAGKLERAAELVVRLAESAEEEPVRLKAALAIPDMWGKLREHGALARRLDELERAVGGSA